MSRLIITYNEGGKTYEQSCPISKTSIIDPDTNQIKDDVTPGNEIDKSGKNLDSYKINRAFTDEICYKKNGEEYIAHLGIENTFVDVSQITSLFYDPDNVDNNNEEQAELIWIDDENEKKNYKTLLDIQFFYPTHEAPDGLVKATWDNDKQERIKKLISKKLKIDDGEMSYEDYQNADFALEKILSELKNKVYISKGPQSFRTPDANPEVTPMIQWTNSGELKIIFGITPPATDLVPEINYVSPSGTPLPGLIRSSLSEEIKNCFKPPYTSVSMEKGIEKLQKEFAKKDASYSVRVWTRQTPMEAGFALQTIQRLKGKEASGQKLSQEEVEELQDAEFQLETASSLKAPWFDEKGKLHLSVEVKPVYKNIALDVVHCNESGEAINKNKAPVNPSALGIKLEYPLNDFNIRKAQKAIIDYYTGLDADGNPSTKRGYLVEIVPEKDFDLYGFTTNREASRSYHMAIKISPAPSDKQPDGSTTITLVTNIGPSEEKVARMFDDPNHPYLTSKSIEKGKQALLGWYIQKGYSFIPRSSGNDIDIRTENGRLIIECQALKIKKYEIVAYNKNTEEWLSEHLNDILREFPVRKDHFFNTDDFNSALMRVAELYPVRVLDAQPIRQNGEIVMDENGEAVMRVTVGHLNGLNWELPTSLGVGNAGPSIGAQFKANTTDDGQQVSTGVTVSGLPPDQIGGELTAGYNIPWLNQTGASMNIHGGAGYFPAYNGYNSQSVGIGMAQPIGDPHSHWSFLYGLDLERLASQVNDPTFWTKPYVGVQYARNGWVVQVKTGPRVSFNGQVYAEVTILARKKKYLSKNRKLFAKAQAEATLRVGANPMDLSSLTMMNLGPFQAILKAKAGILYQVFPFMAIGGGVGVSTYNPFSGGPALVAGAMIEMGGNDILFGPALGPTGLVFGAI